METKITTPFDGPAGAAIGEKDPGQIASSLERAVKKAEAEDFAGAAEVVERELRNDIALTGEQTRLLKRVSDDLKTAASLQDTAVWFADSRKLADVLESHRTAQPDDTTATWPGFSAHTQVLQIDVAAAWFIAEDDLRIDLIGLLALHNADRRRYSDDFGPFAIWSRERQALIDLAVSCRLGLKDDLQLMESTR